MTGTGRFPGLLRFSTSAAGGDLDLSRWERHQAESLVGLRARAGPAAPLSASGAVLALPRLGVGGVSASAHSIVRDDHLIAQRPTGGAIVHFILQRRQRFSSRGGQLEAGPGQAIICDGDTVFSRAFPQPMRELVLLVPRSALSSDGGAGRLAQPRAVDFRRTQCPDGSEGSQDPTRDAARTLAEQISSFLSAPSTESPEAVEERLLRQLTALLAPPSWSAGSRDAAIAHIQGHLHDPGLDAQQIADAAGLSTRQLSRVLAAVGTSVPRAILAARLEAAVQLLGDPQHAHRSMAEIAQEVGFSSPAQFSRSCRDRYGAPPLQLRRQLRCD